MTEGTPGVNLWPSHGWAHMCSCIHAYVHPHKSELKPGEIIKRRHMPGGAQRNHLDLLKSKFRRPELIGNLERVGQKCLAALNVPFRVSTLIVRKDENESFCHKWGRGFSYQGLSSMSTGPSCSSVSAHFLHISHTEI